MADALAKRLARSTHRLAVITNSASGDDTSVDDDSNGGASNML